MKRLEASNLKGLAHGFFGRDGGQALFLGALGGAFLARLGDCHALLRLGGEIGLGLFENH